MEYLDDRMISSSTNGENYVIEVDPTTLLLWVRQRDLSQIDHRETDVV